MTLKPISEGYHTVTPSLVVEGVAKPIDLLMEAFATESIVQMTQPDGTLGHAEIKIGDSRVLMGEATPDFKAMPVMLHL